MRCSSQKNSVVGVAKNDGTELTEGEYITFIDGDNYMGDMLEIIFANEDNNDVVICGLNFVLKNCRKL